MIWRCGARAFDLSRGALVMGILNATPDSFSDGGRYLDPARAVERALEMEAEGAAIIDLGGESTRPGAEPVPEDEELRRVIPVLEGLAGKLRAAVSIDTMKASVARRAIDCGGEIVNDVSAMRADPAMAGAIARSGAGLVLMHMLGVPSTMQADPRYDDPVAEISDFLKERIEAAARAGIPAEAVALDPGFGFGKAFEHNLEIVDRFSELVRLGRPIVVGVSRKRFIRRIAGQKLGFEPEPRSEEARAESLKMTRELLRRGANIFRTHDVAGTAALLRESEKEEE